MSLAAGIAARARRDLGWLRDRLGARRGVLGLCYHALDPRLASYPWRTDPAAFEAQMTLLAETFEVVPVARAVELLREGSVAGRDRPVAAIAFDDGYRCAFERATPVLERLGLHATMFAPRDLIVRAGATHLSPDGLGALAAHPLWEVGGHGLAHEVLTGFLPADRTAEIDGSADGSTACSAPCRAASPIRRDSSTPGPSRPRARFAYAVATDRRAGAGAATDLHQIRRFCPTRAHDDLRAFARALLEAPMEDGVTA